MRGRATLLSAATLLGVAGLVPGQAVAGLLGAGNTVQVFYDNGSTASTEREVATGAMNSDPVSLTAPVSYPAGAADLSRIAIFDTRIVITSLSNAPFCFSLAVGTACGDTISGFDFKFTGENILSVSADPSSAAGFLPVTGTFQGKTHQGLQLLGPDEILIDVTGDAPAINDPLVLDLTFASSSPPPPPAGVPEPATLALLGSGLAGLMAVRGRRKR